jgi:hypothetical protein
MLRHKRDEGGSADGDLQSIGEEFCADPIGEYDQCAAKNDREQPQCGKPAIGHSKDRRGEQIVQRRRIELVAERIDRHRVRVLRRARELVVIGFVVVVALQNGQGLMLDDEFNVVVVRGLVRILPIGGIQRISRADRQVGDERGEQ